MIYVEAPNTSDAGISIFLAGGITGCENWQMNLVNKIRPLDITVFNPRRENFPIHDPNAANAQIKWKYDHLRKASFISFWFCKETMCPIVLFELGQHSMTCKPLLVGMDPKYSRRQDIEIQMGLKRPEIKIVYNLDDLSNQIASMYNQILLI